MIVQLSPGQKFGKLTVVGPAGKVRGYNAYTFNCECGSTKVYPGSVVKNGRQRSCGCARTSGFKINLSRQKPPALAKVARKGPAISVASPSERLALLKARDKALRSQTVSDRLEVLSNIFRATARTF